MSRVAKAPVALPQNVEITIDSNSFTVKGPKGTITNHKNKHVDVLVIEDNGKQITFKPASNDPKAWAQAGTARALVNNMVKGVTDGFSLTLELVGVGYRAQSKSSSVTLSLGFSHNIEYELPKGVVAETPNNTTLILKGIDKQVVGQAASEIQAFRPPEPYKGKGIRKEGQVIVRKEAKKK